MFWYTVTDVEKEPGLDSIKHCPLGRDARHTLDRANALRDVWMS